MTNLHDIATVTAAYLRDNRIAAGEVSALISQIVRTYQGLDGIPEAVAEKTPTRCKHPQQRETRCSDMSRMRSHTENLAQAYR
jgi:predicted transcriptional regulator